MAFHRLGAEPGWPEQFPNMAVSCLSLTGRRYRFSGGAIFAGEVSPLARPSTRLRLTSLNSVAAQNYGDYQHRWRAETLPAVRNTPYAEGIYVGYRCYYETRYEDAVPAVATLATFDYDSEVVYQLGYGLKATPISTGATIRPAGMAPRAPKFVDVTNTGDVAGKDVVEVHAQSPHYTRLGDRVNGVEKSARSSW